MALELSYLEAGRKKSGPKIAPRRPQDAPQTLPRRLTTAQGTPNTAQDASKTVPRGPRCLQETSRCFQEAPRRSEEAPRHLHRRPRRLWDPRGNPKHIDFPLGFCAFRGMHENQQKPLKKPYFGGFCAGLGWFLCGFGVVLCGFGAANPHKKH